MMITTAAFCIVFSVLVFLSHMARRAEEIKAAREKEGRLEKGHYYKWILGDTNTDIHYGEVWEIIEDEGVGSYRGRCVVPSSLCSDERHKGSVEESIFSGAWVWEEVDEFLLWAKKTRDEAGIV